MAWVWASDRESVDSGGAGDGADIASGVISGKGATVGSGVGGPVSLGIG